MPRCTRSLTLPSLCPLSAVSSRSYRDGVYSDESSEGTSGSVYLRGYQLTNTSGDVVFDTVYPGWYAGRTPHVHFRFRVYDGTNGALSYDETLQMFFDDAITDYIYANIYPYTQHTGRDTYNNDSTVYTADNQLSLTGSYSTGYSSTLHITIPLGGSTSNYILGDATNTGNGGSGTTTSGGGSGTGSSNTNPTAGGGGAPSGAAAGGSGPGSNSAGAGGPGGSGSTSGAAGGGSQSSSSQTQSQPTQASSSAAPSATSSGPFGILASIMGTASSSGGNSGSSSSSAAVSTTSSGTSVSSTGYFTSSTGDYVQVSRALLAQVTEWIDYMWANSS